MKKVLESSYPITFRENEAKQLGRYIKQQKSVVLIGMKRVGISNFLRFFINHPDVVSTYINSDMPQVFVQVDLNDLIERNLSAFWTLLLTRIVDSVENSTIPEVEKKKCRKLFVQSIQLKDHFFTVDSLRKVLDIIVSSGVYPTIFLIRFDRLVEVFTEDFLGNLLGLRDSVKQQMSYVFTSHRALPELSPTIFKKQYVSVFTKDMYLPVATHEDMNVIAQTLVEQYQVNISSELMEKLIVLSGGYVQYLQLMLIRLHEEKNPPSIHELESLMSADEQIQLQSEEVYDSLSKSEQTSVKLAQHTSIDVQYLIETGIMSNNGTLFSPLFAQYIQSIGHDAAIGKDLTKKEHILFTFLQAHEGQLCERETIVDTVWPEGHEMGVSDWAVDRLVARLRSKLKAQHSPYLIETVVTRGYKLIKT
jgi:hypothetical protein